MRRKSRLGLCLALFLGFGFSAVFPAIPLSRPRVLLTPDRLAELRQMACYDSKGNKLNGCQATAEWDLFDGQVSTNSTDMGAWNFALAYRKRLFELLWVGAERRLEEKRIFKFFPRTTIECHQDFAAQPKPCELLLVAQHFSAGTTLVTPVEEAALGSAVGLFKFLIVEKKGTIAGKQLRVTPAAFIHQFPE